MARAKDLRNFRIELTIDGTSRPAEFVGPIGEQGGFVASIYMREHGRYREKNIELFGRVDETGELVLEVEIDGKTTELIRTKR